MFQKLLFSFILFGISNLIIGQTVSSQIIDSETKLPVAFATVQTDTYNGVMTNEEGKFSIYLESKSSQDSLTISCLGYKTLNIPLSKKVEKTIYLTPEVYDVIPIFLSSKNYTAEEIIDLTRANLEKNYNLDYQKAEVFIRNSGQGNIRKFNVKLEKSTINAINQKLLDNTFSKINRKYIYLNESLQNIVLQDYNKGQIAPKKTLYIQSKEELATGEKLQADFMKIMEENFKSDSQLILKTGIIRLDKTESIDSILKVMEKEMDNSKDSVQKEGKTYPFALKDLFIFKDGNANFIHNPNKYIFEKKGYTTIGENWVYIIEFYPKNNAKFKGNLYINAEDFAIVKAEYKNADAVYDKHFNMFGIKANSLKFSSVEIFIKKDNKYYLSYIKHDTSNEVGINRPLTVVEKNENVKGKSRINKVEVNFDLYILNQNKFEAVFTNYSPISKSDYENFKPYPKFSQTSLNQYDTHFWDGYNILTPEKAIQELKIDE